MIKYLTTERLILGGLVIFFLLMYFNQRGVTERKAEQITSLELENQQSKDILNSKDVLITTQKTIITESQAAMNKLTDTIFDLKRKDAKGVRTLAYFKAAFKARIQGLSVPYVASRSISSENLVANIPDSLKEDCGELVESLLSKTVPVDTKAVISNDSLFLAATIKKESLQIDSLVIPDTIQLRFVEHRGKLFKKKYTEVQYFHSNPIFKTDKINSVMYSPKKKGFIQKFLVPVAIGVGAGLILAK